MRRVLRSPTAHLSLAPALLMLTPSPVLASDFGAVVWDALLMLAIVGTGGLILAAATAALLVRVYRRRWVWFLVPVFVIAWSAAILGLLELWGSYQYEAAPPEVPVQPPPGPVPEQ